MVSGEFGRTYWSQAGGGVKPGCVHGETDDLGYRPIDGRVHLHDLHATILHLLGIEQARRRARKTR